MNNLIPIKIGDYLELITDYHSNGAYKKLKENVELLSQKNYAVMIRTLNFERNDFRDDLLYVTKEAYDFLGKSYILPNDILMNKIANAGSVYIMPNMKCPVTCGMNLFLIRFKKQVNQRYMFYNMKNSEGYIKSFAHGTTTTTITKDEVRNIDLWIHPRKEQDRIERILTSIDSKIDNNNKINEELESMAKTIYDYWFLQFEFPNEDGKPYKSSGGKMVWNEELKREIPEGWKVGRLHQLIKQDKGGDWGKEFPEGNYTEKVTCLRGADFPSICGSAKLEAPDRFINKKNIFKTLKKGDLIIEISGGSPTQSTGRICYINTNVLKRFKNELITSNFCKAINLIDEDFMYWFYNLWCKLYDSGVFFKYEGKTTGIKNLLFEMLCRDYPIIIPDTDVIKTYNSKIEKLFDTIQQNLLENTELISLRDFLLPLLMNGQVGFKD